MTRSSSDTTEATTETEQPTEPRTFHDSDEAAAYLNQRIAEAAERQAQQEREQAEERQRDEDARRQDAINTMRGYVEKSVDADVLAALNLRYDAERSGVYSFNGYAVFTLQPEDAELHLSFAGFGEARLHDHAYSVLNHSQSIVVHLNPQTASAELLLGIATFRTRLAEIAAKRAADAADAANAAVEPESAQPAEPTEPAQPQTLSENSYSRTVLLGANATSAKTATFHSNGAIDVADLSAYAPDPADTRRGVTFTLDEFRLLAAGHAAWMDSLTARNAVTADDDEVPF